jgi:hypothetical protein
VGLSAYRGSNTHEDGNIYRAADGQCAMGSLVEEALLDVDQSRRGGWVCLRSASSAAWCLPEAAQLFPSPRNCISAVERTAGSPKKAPGAFLGRVQPNARSPKCPYPLGCVWTTSVKRGNQETGRNTWNLL